MSKRTGLIGGSAVGILGYVIGRLSSGDLKSLASQFLTGMFEFLRQQGAYASFAIVLTVGFGWLSVWCIRRLIDGKQGEIDRIVEDRDKFQKLLIDDWQSSRTDMKGTKKK